MNTITMFIKRFTELICLGISFYAGRLYRDGVEAEPLDLLSNASVYNTSVGAASTKTRTKNSLPIIPMDITDMLASYVNDMEYFCCLRRKYS